MRSCENVHIKKVAAGQKLILLVATQLMWIDEWAKDQLINSRLTVI